MHESFKRLLEASNGLSQEEIARRIDESPQTLTNWKKRGVSKAGALKAAAEFTCSANWILKGAAEGYGDAVSKSTGWDGLILLSKDEVEISFYDEAITECGAIALLSLINKTTSKIKVKSSLLSKYYVNPINAIALIASGNAMSPVINEDAIVYVDVGRTSIIDGKIYAVCHGGLFKFCYLYKLPKGGIRVVSANSDEYKDEVLSFQDIIDQEFDVLAYAFCVQNPLP